MPEPSPHPETIRVCNTCAAWVPTGQPCLACALLQIMPAPEERVGARFDPAALPCAFGPYEVRREIAVGGMGAVYEAFDPRLGRTVAIKMMRSLLLATAGEKARFKTEAGAAAKLDHPHIVPVYEVGEYEGQPHFTMKLIEGGSLAERLKEGPLSPREAAALMAKVAQAVEHAHERGVLHRDLKPGNIVLDRAGSPWLTDFGLAKVTAADSSLTLTQSFLGTPEYMSPEQAAGRTREVGPASDVWALGAILFQLVTGRLPFPGQGQGEVLQSIIYHEPASIVLPASGPRELVSRDLQTIILRCLVKEPAARLRSAGFLAEELERWLAGEPIRSRGITATERAVRWARRHPWPLAAAVLFAAVVALVFSFPRQRGLQAAPPTVSARAFQNGSFETNGGDKSGVAEGWAFLGTPNGVKIGSGEGTSDGRCAAIFNGSVHATNGMLAQTFATVAGQAYTVQFDYGNFGFISLCVQKLQVEVRAGASALSGEELIQSGSGRIESATDGALESNASTVIVADKSGAVQADQQFSRVFFTFTAQSAASTLVFTDVSSGYILDQDGVLDNVQVIAAP